MIEDHDRRTWAAGDFSRVATGQVIVGERLCEAVELHARERVLDVATGSGNTALAAARRRAEVTGVDFVPALLERARIRAAAEQLQVEFREGRAEALPFEDGSFDCVLSTFGVMFALDATRAAGELVRVCRPGGRIGLATWVPEGIIADLFRAIGRHAPSLAAIPGALRWGTEAGLRELLATVTGQLSARRRVVRMRADSPDAYVAFFRRFFGPTIVAFETLGPEEAAALEADLLGLVARANTARDGTAFVPAEYLETIVRRR